MEMRYFDIHSHFNLPQFEADLSSSIKKLEDEGIATICVGTDLASSKRAIEIASMSPNIWATIGQHPTDTDEALDTEAFAVFSELAKHPKVVAIGECGFDFFRINRDSILKDGKTSFNMQKDIFLRQIEIAKSSGKPLMVHARPSKGSMDAYEDVINFLSNFPEVRANFHFFVGDIAIAQKALDAGHAMSFDGPITFSHDYDDVIKMLPPTSIMVETDSPFAAPTPYRGKRCEPWMVREVVKAIAAIRGQDEDTVREATVGNAKRFFNIVF
jgi:TatD DNase family protein